MTNELATLDTNQWEVMKQQAGMLVKTGFLPEAIKTPEQAVAIMLKGRELGIPPMYALSNIVVIKGKPSCDAALMLSLIYRDHGDDAAKWDDDATNDKVATLLYKRRGWSEYKRHTFTIEDAQRAGLAGSNTWKQYPGAMLRARCISAVARMAFPDSIGGMYTPEELGAHVVEQVDSDHDHAMRRLHAIAREHGVDHDTLHALAVQDYNVGSLRDMSIPQLSEFAVQIERDSAMLDDMSGEVIDAETGEIVEHDTAGKAPGSATSGTELAPMNAIEEEHYAALLAAKSMSALNAEAAKIADGGVTHPALRDAYRTRRDELQAAKETKQPELVGAAAGEAGNDSHTR